MDPPFKRMKSDAQSESLLIWYQLLESTTGKPYKETSASSILRSSLVVPIIDQFRDAVMAKNSNKLSSIDSSDLLVYKNKAAFVGKEDTLEEDALVVGLGTLKQEALIVVVPSSIQTQLTPCNFPFFLAICNTTENNGWLSFEQEKIPSTILKELYIRDSYEMIASSIMTSTNKIIVTGTPGIGKSLFLIYFLWFLVKKEKRILFIFGPDIIYYDGKGGVFTFASGGIPHPSNSDFWNEALWCLFDSKGKKESDLSIIPYDRCKCIVATCPRRDIVNDFKKDLNPKWFVMPLWTKDELEAIARLFPDSDAWLDRFEILGGIPRHVLEITENSPTQILKEACSDCTLDNCIRKIGIHSRITESSKSLHALVHMTSVSPYTESSVCYASPTAVEIIVREKRIRSKCEIRELLESSEGNPLIASLCGYIFEPYAIELLEKGGPFKCRELVRGNTNPKPAETELEIPKSEKKIVKEVLSNQALNQLYVPSTKNYTAIDAWIPGIGAFQMTVGKNHDIKNVAIDDLAKLGKANRLYWLLPPLHYPSFVKKTPQTITQYALEIPYPSVT
jgi:hypothetical protein